MKNLTLTAKQLKTLCEIRELNFKKISSFTDYRLASGEEQIDITKVNKKVRALLIEFFKTQQTPKRGDRVKTQNIYIQTHKGKISCVIITYRALHGFGYSWAYDAEGEFKSWIIKSYSVKKTSKTYKNILNSSFNY